MKQLIGLSVTTRKIRSNVFKEILSSYLELNLRTSFYQSDVIPTSHRKFLSESRRKERTMKLWL